LSSSLSAAAIILLPAANTTSATPVKMKPLEDVAINDNDDTGKKTERRKLLPRMQKKWLKKNRRTFPQETHHGQ
jgi:hypothetical protein